MRSRSSQIVRVTAALMPLSLTIGSCLWLEGCGTMMAGALGGTQSLRNPPYVADDPKAKGGDPCQTQTQGSQSNQPCRKTASQ